MLMDELLH